MVERPTRAAALKASFVLQGFVSDLDDQFACEMRAVLAKFGRQNALGTGSQPPSDQDYGLFYSNKYQ